jgi:hypothetical protein
MVAITLTKEQSTLLAAAEGPITVRDISGREVAVLTRTDDSESPLSITPEELQVLLDRMGDDPNEASPIAEVLQRIKSRTT